MVRFMRRGRLAPAPVDVRDDESPPATSRRSFVRASSGVAALATIPAATVLTATADAKTRKVKVPAEGVAVANPTTNPAEPLMAYVQSAKAGTVVIVTGTTERTVKDRELVRRLTVKPKKKRKKRVRKHKKSTPTKKG